MLHFNKALYPLITCFFHLILLSWLGLFLWFRELVKHLPEFNLFFSLHLSFLPCLILYLYSFICPSLYSLWKIRGNSSCLFIHVKSAQFKAFNKAFNNSVCLPFSGEMSHLSQRYCWLLAKVQNVVMLYWIVLKGVSNILSIYII